MRIKKKLKGVALIATAAAVAAWILLSYGIFITQSSQFQMIGAGKTAMTAQQYAEVNANLLRLVDYDKLDDTEALASVKLHKERGQIQTVDNAEDWEDEISIGSEQKNGSSDDGVFRIGTIKIYKKGDTTPRYSVDVPLVKGMQGATQKELQELSTQLGNEIDQLQSNLAAYESATNKNISSLQSQINKNAQAITTNLNSLKSLIDKNSAAIAAANVNINANKTDISAAKAKITTLQGTISGMQTTVNQLKKDLAAETSARKNADKKNADDIVAIKSDVSALSSQYSTLKNSLDGSISKIESIESTIRSIQFTIDPLKYNAYISYADRANWSWPRPKGPRVGLTACYDRENNAVQMRSNIDFGGSIGHNTLFGYKFDYPPGVGVYPAIYPKWEAMREISIGNKFSTPTTNDGFLYINAALNPNSLSNVKNHFTIKYKDIEYTIYISDDAFCIPIKHDTEIEVDSPSVFLPLRGREFLLDDDGMYN